MKKFLIFMTLILITSVSFSAVVINEVKEDTVGVDTGEFIELYGTPGTDISGYMVKLINGAAGIGTPYSTITVPAATVIPLDGFYVIGNTTYVANVDLHVPTVIDLIQNGTPDAIRLENSSGVLQDMFAYELDIVGGLAGDTIGEGGAGRTFSASWTGDTGDFTVYARIPDGYDTNVNKRDWFSAPETPGTSNTQSSLLSLPVTDNFDNGEIAPWTIGFTLLRTVTPASIGIPASPQGGKVLYTMDPTGGGEEACLPFGNNLENPRVTGQFYVATTDLVLAEQMYGIGVCVVNSINWFSAASGNGMEDGYYLIYQNGNLTATGQSIFALNPGKAGFYRVVATPGAGTATYRVATLLGSLATPAQGAWTNFTISVNSSSNNIFVTLGSETLYNSTIPAGGPNRGSVAVGYREFGTGNPSNTNGNQGTVIDALQVNSNNVSISPSGTVVVMVGANQGFTASAGTGTYTWSLSTIGVGSLSTTAGSSVTFTAASSGTVILTVNDGTHQASVTIISTPTSAPLLKETENTSLMDKRFLLIE